MKHITFLQLNRSHLRELNNAVKKADGLWHAKIGDSKPMTDRELAKAKADIEKQIQEIAQ